MQLIAQTLCSCDEDDEDDVVMKMMLLLLPKWKPRKMGMTDALEGCRKFSSRTKARGLSRPATAGDRADSEDDKFPECESRILRSPAKKNGRGRRLVEEGGATLREN